MSKGTTGHIITGDGTISLVHENQGFNVSRDHPAYAEVVSAIHKKDYKSVLQLLNRSHAVQRVKNVTVKGGKVYYKGKEVGGVVVSRILEFVHKNLPIRPLLHFLENLKANPSAHSVEQLYSFLVHGHFPITDDGCFIGYKSIRVYKDEKTKKEKWVDWHTGEEDNRIGKSPRMARRSVDANPDSPCSNGYHVGTYGYAKNFNHSEEARIVLVKVNPKDCVSVPNDHNHEKLRVSTYKVIGVAKGDPISSQTYRKEQHEQHRHVVAAVIPLSDDYDDEENDFDPSHN